LNKVKKKKLHGIRRNGVEKEYGRLLLKGRGVGIPPFLTPKP
jgi:hypothetical protein